MQRIIQTPRDFRGPSWPLGGWSYRQEDGGAGLTGGILTATPGGSAWRCGVRARGPLSWDVRRGSHLRLLLPPWSPHSGLLP